MIIGVDLGGTNIRAGLINGEEIIEHHAIPIREKHSLESTINQLLSVVHSVFNKEVTGIGVGVPSVVDLENGIVYDVVNIPSWKEVHLRDILVNEFGVPVFINNDVNCFVLGEKYFGFGKKYKNIVGVALGTGIGSGVIIENKLFSGVNCGAGEIGYLPYKDHDLEYYCSSNFFETIYNTKGHEVFTRAENNDREALKLWDEFGYNVGVALRSVLYAYDPEAIILGGSISKALPFFKTQMYNALNDTYFPKSVEKLKIYVSEIKHVAMLGAAAQVNQYLETVKS